MKLKFEKAYYEAKKTLSVQRDEVERYHGYFIINEDDNAQCEIVKPAQVKVVIVTEKLQKLTFKATEKVMALYPECETLEEAFVMFEHAAKKNKLQFSLSEHGSLIIQ